MLRSLFIIPLTLVLIFISCASEKENLLVGKWTAVELLENNDSLAVNLDEIWFSFDENQQYSFHSTLNYNEAGTYEVVGDLLYTTDTINEISQRKAVKLLELNENSLKIEMKVKKAVRILSLIKE